MVTAKKYTLQREDGSAVTAQEVYDALMAGPVWLITANGYVSAYKFSWRDSNGGVTNPTNVGVIKVDTGEQQITIGDKSLFGK